MCQFFSCVSDGKGNVMYFDAKMRQKILAGETEYQDTDSHTSIAHFYGYRGREEDKLNKYEYNPLTTRFRIDQLNADDDSKQIKAFCMGLDFSIVVPELVIKDITHPLRDVMAGDVTAEIVTLLENWASVWDSVGDSVWASVWDSVGAYRGSFFNLNEWKYVEHEPNTYPFQPLVDLWELGFVPSFDGKTWRLHAGPEAKIVYEMEV